MNHRRARSLNDLLVEAGMEPGRANSAITGIACDSRLLAEGELFVALPGTQHDGADFLRDAAARGAAAIVVRRGTPAEGLAVPLIEVDDPHVSLARLASAFHGHPERSLQLIGITGTLGKTSTALLLETALSNADPGQRVGVIGSLGAFISDPSAGGPSRDPLPGFEGMTTPDAPVLFRTLRSMVDAGVHLVLMEVTSHALAQHRTDGLKLALGIVTNLVPDEHLEYHGSPDDYLATKRRFFDLLDEAAPVVINADDALVWAMTREVTAAVPHPVIAVSLRGLTVALEHRGSSIGEQITEDAEADVCVAALQTDPSGAAFNLRVRRPIPRVGGNTVQWVEPCEMPIVLPVLGVQQVANAALAATAALVLGATRIDIAEALADVEPMRRRMSVVRDAAPVVVDDTTGNPETLRAVFASVAELERSTLRIVFGIRGMRGTEINRRLGNALAKQLRVEMRRSPVDLLVTACEDATDTRNRVQPDEQEAMLSPLRVAGVPFVLESRLADAARGLATRCGPGDLVLLLGAQGMDRAAELVLAELDAAGVACRSDQR